MTTTVASTSSDAQPVPAHLIAGLDAMAVSERAAEHMLSEVLAALRPVGGDQITTATHRVQVFHTAHVAMSIAIPTIAGEPGIFELLRDMLGKHAAGAVWTDGAGAGPAQLQASTRQAATAHRDRTSGRVVQFPGSHTLTGTVPFGQVLATAIDRLEPLGGDQPAPDSVLVTRDFVRPRWQGGELVLHIQPAVGGTWVPFETPNPTPCCAVHG